MTQPYRENPESVPAAKPKAPGVEPLTEGELAFWDAVYVAYASRTIDGWQAVDRAHAADKAVRFRRERFGVR